MTFDPKLAHAIREAAARNPDGTPLPAGHRRTLSPAEVGVLREKSRAGAGFGEAARQPAPAVRSAPVPGSVAEQHPEWLEAGFIDKIVAEVAARTAAVTKLETDPGRLRKMDSETLAEHIADVAEAAESMGVALPLARVGDPKQLREMSDADFKQYSIGVLSAPTRLEPSPHVRRLREDVDIEGLAAVSESARAASGGPTFTEAAETTANEAILEAHRSALRATGRARSPFWR